MGQREIWVFAEFSEHEVAPVSFEMLSEARKLAKELKGKTCVCLIGKKDGEIPRSLQKYGAEKIYRIESKNSNEPSIDVYASILQNLIQKFSPFIILFGATPSGSELAPRIAARLKLPCITEVKRIGGERDNLVIGKSCYNEKVYQNYNFHPEKTVVLTVLPGDMNSEEADGPRELEVVNEDIYIERGMTRTKTIKFIKGDPKKIRLEEANLVIAGGKGIGKDMAIIEDLADLLGASIGGSRPLVDDGMIPFERQIGITGKSVTPKLLMACGISGAREFVAGMDKAMLTIAINRDAKAPIFKFANLGIVGDLHEIIPFLIDRIKVLKQKCNREEGNNSPL